MRDLMYQNKPNKSKASQPTINAYSTIGRQKIKTRRPSPRASKQKPTVKNSKPLTSHRSQKSLLHSSPSSSKPHQTSSQPMNPLEL